MVTEETNESKDFYDVLGSSMTLMATSIAPAALIGALAIYRSDWPVLTPISFFVTIIGVASAINAFLDLWQQIGLNPTDLFGFSQSHKISTALYESLCLSFWGLVILGTSYLVYCAAWPVG